VSECSGLSAQLIQYSAVQLFGVQSALWLTSLISLSRSMGRRTVQYTAVLYSRVLVPLGSPSLGSGC